MNSLATRIGNMLRRPSPDLMRYCVAKLNSLLWKRSLRHAGSGFFVSAGAQIQGGEHIHIGDGFFAGQMLWIEAVRSYAGQQFHPTIQIGNGVQCSQNVHIAATTCVVIGDGVLFGSRVHVTDHGHGTYRGEPQDAPDVPPALRRLATGRPVVIERNVWLGDGVVVLPGVTIGAGSIIGANSVVSRDVPPGVIAVGAPATPIKRYDSGSARWLPITQ